MRSHFIVTVALLLPAWVRAQEAPVPVPVAAAASSPPPASTEVGANASNEELRKELRGTQEQLLEQREMLEALKERLNQVAAAPSAPTEAKAQKPGEAKDEGKKAEPLAGYNGSFFLRDPNNYFVLFPKGRLQIDAYTFPQRGDAPTDPTQNNTSKDARPRDTIFLRRARLEIAGTFARYFDFTIGGEFATTPATGAYATVTDAFVTANFTQYAQLQVGQFDVPFTMENRTSDKYFDFMERSLAVRAFAVPGNKDIGGMVWGYLPSKVFYYSAGVFNGDGQNFKNQDNYPAVIARAFVAPLAPFAKGRRWMEELEVGGSFWWEHSTNLGLANGVLPSTSAGTANDIATMSTQGGFSFFSSSYGNGKDVMGNAIRSHLAPAGDTLKWAVEAHLPWKRFGIKWELVHQTIDLALYNDSNPLNASILRGAPTGGIKLDGYATYAEFYVWILGGREMIESPGLEPHPRLKEFKPTDEPRWGLQALAKYEYVNFDVTGLPGVGAAGATDPAEGNYHVHVAEVGLNAWLTKHVRLTANYVMNYIDGDSANVKKNIFYQKPEHELLFRVGINL